MSGKNSMKILFATGGTGGHIYPAIALANRLKKEHQILFVGTDNRMEHTIIPQHGFDFKSIHIESYEGSIISRIKALATVGTSYFEAKKIVKQYKPDLIIGFGGYVSLPLLMVGKRLKIKTLVHEQNSVMGQTNKMMYKDVDGVIVCYKNLLETYPDKKVRLLGNPRSSEILESFDQKYFDSLNLDKNKKKVLIVMGSQGSVTMNHKLVGFLNQVSDEYEYLFVIGKRDYSLFKDKITNPNIKVYDYLEQGKILAKIDLIIARAGATTVSEITALGIPSILIPSPYVAHNHQYFNARELIKEKASILMQESDFTAQRLEHSISHILEDENFYQTLSKNALKLGTPNAIEDIIHFIGEIMDE